MKDSFEKDGPAKKDGGKEDAERKFWEGEHVDPELAAMEAPRPKKRRHPWFMIAVMVIGLLMIYWFRVDVLYFFASQDVSDLGEVSELDLSTVETNTYVHVDGFPNPTTVVKFSKRLHGGFYRIFPLLGKRNVFVQIHVDVDEGREDVEGGKKKRAKSELPGEFTGRAVRFGDLEKTWITSSSYRNIRVFFFEKFLLEVPEETLLIMDGENPRSYWMYLVLVLVLGFFIVFNAILLVNYFRRR
ncbi:MAG: hypothetical protein ABIJ56_01510 [Pseudomonadota bacterium]